MKLDNLIQKKQISFSKEFLESGTSLSRGHASSMTRAVSRTVLCRSRVSSMTGGCTYPIYYQRAVSVDKGRVIIRYKLPELFKKVS